MGGGLLHSGIQALIEIFRNELPVITVGMIHGIQAKTGGRPVHPMDVPAFVAVFGDLQVVRWSWSMSIEMMSEEIERLEGLHRPSMVLVEAS